MGIIQERESEREEEFDKRIQQSINERSIESRSIATCANECVPETWLKCTYYYYYYYYAIKYFENIHKNKNILLQYKCI